MSLTFLALSSMNAYLKYTNQAHRRVYNIHLYLNVRGISILSANIMRSVQNFDCIFDVIIRKTYFLRLLNNYFCDAIPSWDFLITIKSQSKRANQSITLFLGEQTARLPADRPNVISWQPLLHTELLLDDLQNFKKNL